MNLTRMRKQALAAREAHLALLDLKKLVDRAVRTTHAAELEAVHFAVMPQTGRGIPASLAVAMEDLRTVDFELSFSQAREKVHAALLWRDETSKEGE